MKVAQTVMFAQSAGSKSKNNGSSDVNKTTRMAEITCSKCGKVFYRSKPLNWPMRCPSCHALLSEPAARYAGQLRRYDMIQYAVDPKVAAARAEVKAAGIRAKAVRHAATEAKWARTLKPTFEARLAKSVGHFVKRHSGLISMLIAAPAIASEIQLMIRKADQKRAAENYNWEGYAGLGGSRRTIAKLVGKAKRKRRFRKGVMRFPKRHPKTMMVAGGAGLGSWAMQRKQRNDQMGQSHYASTTALALRPSKAARTAWAAWRTTKKTGRSVLQTGGKIALGGLISWIAMSILQELEKKRLPAIGPYMPEVRPDIEMARYTIGQVSANVAEIPTAKLYSLQSKALETVAKIKGLPHKAKVGAEKGLLMWLLGFVSAELLGRGITTPKRRISVEGEIPIRQVPSASYEQPFDPREWIAQNKAFDAGTRRIVKGIKRDRRHAAFRTIRRHSGKVAVAALPLAALTALVASRKVRQGKQEKYFAAAAAVGAAAKVAKVGKLATAGRWGNRLLTGWIAADLIGAVLPKKKKKPGMTGGQTGPAYKAPQYYGISRVPVRRLMELRWLAKTKVPIKGKRQAIAQGLTDVANRIKAERAAAIALIAGAGVGGAVVGKKLERRRVRQAVG
ncbi:hypothetical protein LCGC14_1458290 [marine sediment metagenome]|uniref:Uncharacterized protein n=1 Tax=marine sediment metagenome TaxID=412755 RepID=A0A0F9MHT3_9ZZZZ